MLRDRRTQAYYTLATLHDLVGDIIDEHEASICKLVLTFGAFCSYNFESLAGQSCLCQAQGCTCVFARMQPLLQKVAECIALCVPVVSIPVKLVL